MKVLCVQTPRMPLEKSATYLVELSEEVSNLEFDLMVLPEKWVNSSTSVESEQWMEILANFITLSTDHNAAIVPGSFSFAREDGLYNSAPVIIEGRLAGFQDKISLYKNENGKYRSGSDINVFELNGMKFSVPVCYDLDFPYFAKIAVDKGANFLVNPSLISSEFKEMWHIYVRGRSLENRLPVISVNSLSEPFNGGSIVTRMHPKNGGIILESVVMGEEHHRIIETNSGELEEYVKARRLEDFGIYSFRQNP